MKKVLPFVLTLSVALLLRGTALCGPPRHPGVAVVGGDSQERPEAIQPTNKQTVNQAILETILPANPMSQSIQVLIQNAKKWKWELDSLSRPKYNLIPAADIGKYRFTDRYLDIGGAAVSHYFILQEDYVFRNLNGDMTKIPAGFIWDGASIPKALGAMALEVGNTRYNSAIAEGLIHDYMYRNPQRYTKDEADVLFFINLRRCNNPNPLAMYEGVYFVGGFAYLKHMNKQRQGDYDVFTPEFYAENLKTFQSGNDSTLEKKEEKRKICTCASPDVFFAGVCKKRVGVINNKLWAQYYCRNCGGFRRGSMFELMNTGNGVAVYPAGSVPSNWDGKIYEQSDLDAHVMSLIESATGKATNTNAGEGSISNSHLTNTDVGNQESTPSESDPVGVRGWCDCGDKHGKRYVMGDMFCMCNKLKCDLAYTLCGRCGCAVRPKDCAGDGLQIVDLNLWRELKRRNGGKLSWSDAFKPLKERQAEIEAMPNGRIIAGGACVCKEADPIKVGFTNKITGEFFVCCLCGRVREPDKNGDIPTGPTALSEMGLNDQARKAEERIDKWLNGRSE